MTEKEFKQVVDEAVAAGGDRKQVEDYVRSGFKVDFGSTAAASTGTATKKRPSRAKKPRQ